MTMNPFDWGVSLPPIDRDSYTEKTLPSGLTKREYFALKLHAAILTDPDSNLESAPFIALEQADALMAALAMKRKE